MAVTETDTLLVRHVRAGNAEAWRQLIERFEGRLLAFVDSRLRDRAASEDVVQETFIGFLTSLPHYDEKRDMEAYLFSIAAHKLTDHLRKQGRRPIVVEPPRASRGAANAARPRNDT
jgi:RNA polymerase sigma-70 factor (ECF subfamily)